MAYRLILLVLPPLIFAKIDIEIIGVFKNNESTLTVHFAGDETGILTDTERNTFNLSDFNLKNAVQLHYGKRPHEAYLRSPTPWGDLYDKYRWDQVTRTLKPISSKVVKILPVSTDIFHQYFENYNSKPKTYTFGVSEDLQQTVSSSWTTEGELSIGQNISYDIKLKAFHVGENISFSYTSPWGKRVKQFQVATVGLSSSSLSLVLQTGQSIIAKLIVAKRIIQLEIEYVASLSGQIALNYIDTYGESNFCALKIKDCMKSAGLSNRIMSKEVIDIVLYEDTKVSIVDL